MCAGRASPHWIVFEVRRGRSVRWVQIGGGAHFAHMGSEVLSCAWDESCADTLQWQGERCLRSASGSAGRRACGFILTAGHRAPLRRHARPSRSSIRAGSFPLYPGRLERPRSGRVSRPLAIAVGGRRLDRLFPDCRCPPACSLRAATVPCSPSFGPFGGAGYVNFSRAALPRRSGAFGFG
jgi:hypothetical protein